MHCKDSRPNIFPAMKLQRLSPNSYIYVSVIDLYMYSHDQSANSAAGKQVDRSWEYIIRSQKHECGNWD
jgi:hypothetical protein